MKPQKVFIFCVTISNVFLVHTMEIDNGKLEHQEQVSRGAPTKKFAIGSKKRKGRRAQSEKPSERHTYQTNNDLSLEQKVDKVLDLILVEKAHNATLAKSKLQQGSQQTSATSDDLSKELIIQAPPKRKYIEEPDVILNKKFPKGFPPEFMTMISFIKEPQVYKDAGKKVPNKFLLHGKPGTGKSFLIEEMLHRDYQLPMIYLNSTELRKKFYGQSEEKIGRLFSMRDPKKEKTLLIFIDEIDGIATERDENKTDVARATLVRMLSEIHKNYGDPFLLVMITTNDKHCLDNALLDRFSQTMIEFHPMDSDERAQMLKLELEGLTLENKDKVIKTIVSQISGFNRRNLSEALDAADAWLFSLRQSKTALTTDELVGFITRNKNNRKVPMGIKARKFVIWYMPFINFAQGITSITSAFHGGIFQHVLYKNAKAMQRLAQKWGLYDRMVQLVAFSQANATKEITVQMKPIFEGLKSDDGNSFDEVLAITPPYKDWKTRYIVDPVKKGFSVASGCTIQ